jgi:hypothetical protein
LRPNSSAPDFLCRSNEYSPWSPSGITQSATGSMTPSSVACVLAISFPILTPFIGLAGADVIQRAASLAA